MPSRWDFILDQKPVPVIDYLLVEAARLFANDLRQWPPQVDAEDPSTAQTLAALFEENPESPSKTVWNHAFQLAKWDLERADDAREDYFRNQRWTEAGLSVQEKPMLLFLSRWILEQLLAFGEATHGRVNRPRLVEVLTHTQRNLLEGARA